MSELISPPSTWSERPCAGMKEGWRVKEWGSGGVGEAGDSRLLACVVFPLRDLYTDAVGINFWWTIGTASSPLALSSHPISPHSLSPSLSFSYRLFPPTYVSSLSYMLLFFLLLWSICLASWNLQYLCQSSSEGLRDLGWTSLIRFPCLLLLEAQQIFQSKSASVYCM